MITKETHISFECAKLLNNVNYSWGWYDSHVYENSTTVSQYYDNDNLAWVDAKPVDDGYMLVQARHQRNYNDFYIAPSQSSLQRWLREEQKLHIEISLENFSDEYIWQYAIYEIGEDCTNPKDFDGEYNSYEEALEEGLKKALNRIIDESNK